MLRRYQSNLRVTHCPHVASDFYCAGILQLLHSSLNVRIWQMGKVSIKFVKNFPNNHGDFPPMRCAFPED